MNTSVSYSCSSSPITSSTAETPTRDPQSTSEDSDSPVGTAGLAMSDNGSPSIDETETEVELSPDPAMRDQDTETASPAFPAIPTADGASTPSHVAVAPLLKDPLADQTSEIEWEEVPKPDTPELGIAGLEAAMRVVEVEKKLVKIYKAVEVDHSIIKDIESRRYPRAVARVALQQWMISRINRGVVGFDPLEAQAFRTSVGQLLVRLQKHILQLDEVESNGNKAIRGMRRQIVHHITDTVIPKADNLLSSASKLVTMEAKVRQCAKARVAVQIATDKLQAKEEKKAAAERKKEADWETLVRGAADEAMAEMELRSTESSSSESGDEGEGERDVGRLFSSRLAPTGATNQTAPTPAKARTIVRTATPTISGNDEDEEEESPSYQVVHREKDVLVQVELPSYVNVSRDVEVSLLRRPGHDLLLLSDRWGRFEEVKFKLDSRFLDSENVHQLPHSSRQPTVLQFSVPRRTSSRKVQPRRVPQAPATHAHAHSSLFDGSGRHRHAHPRTECPPGFYGFNHGRGYPAGGSPGHHGPAYGHGPTAHHGPSHASWGGASPFGYTRSYPGHEGGGMQAPGASPGWGW